MQLHFDKFLYLWPQEIHKNKFNLKNLRYGYLHYVFIPEEKEFTILYLYVSKEIRKLGYGTKLMNKLFSIIQEEIICNQFDKIIVKLDDVSDKFGLEDNLYKNFGFEYINLDENGVPVDPEMIKIVNRIE